MNPTRHYSIDDRWFDTDEGGDYIDIMEIRQNPSQSLYLQWLLTQNPSIVLAQEQQKASFYDWGIHVGDNDGGNDIRGIMREDGYIDDNEYIGGRDYPQIWKRIYKKGTTARHIWFLGYGSYSYGNNSYTSINANGVVQ